MVAIGTLAHDGVNNLARHIIAFGKQLAGEVGAELFSETDGRCLDPNASP